MDNMIVRTMKPLETARVQELFETVYRDTFTGNVPAFDTVTRGERIYVALLNGVIAGIATVWEPDAFIHFLFVDVRARRKGVGSAIIYKLAETYGCSLTLKCLIENSNGMAFYQATGWNKVEIGHAEEGAYALLRYVALHNQI